MLKKRIRSKGMALVDLTCVISVYGVEAENFEWE
jgi:hypothetical protein